MQFTLVIDFDSTFTKLEAVDELAAIALKNAPDREKRVREIQAITEAGMEGRMGFHASLSQRLTLFSPSGEQIEQLISLLRRNVTTSIVQHRDDIREMSANVYVISGGFKEFILPIVEPFGIPASHVLANTFTLDDAGRVTGCDPNNPLSGDDGKVQAIRALGLEGRVVMVGDGYSDWRTKEAGVVDEFVAFVENVRREAATEHADIIAKDFGAVLEFCYSVKA